MATAALPQDPDLDQLRAQARELQRAVRNGTPARLKRVNRWHPAPPGAETFPLTAAQLVLAREYGFASWARMRRYVKIVTARAWGPGRPAPENEPLADRFLRLACLSYSGDQPADRAAAAELLDEHPDLPRHNLLVASACADVSEVRRHLAGRLAGAATTGGPHRWSPLPYQAYARHNPGVELTATLETARLLLGAGADPNDSRFWHALPTPFTVLTGVLGYGEWRQPWHPHTIAFARLLLESGADPNDGQALYNRMFATNDDHLVLLFEYGLGGNTRGPWHRLLGESLEPPTEMLRSLLAWAIIHDQRDRVVLLAEHGVDIESPFTEQRSPKRGTPVEVALINGHRELADQLRGLGARPPRGKTKASWARNLGGGTGCPKCCRASRLGRLRRPCARPRRPPQQRALAHCAARRRRERQPSAREKAPRSRGRPEHRRQALQVQPTRMGPPLRPAGLGRTARADDARHLGSHLARATARCSGKGYGVLQVCVPLSRVPAGGAVPSGRRRPLARFPLSR